MFQIEGELLPYDSYNTTQFATVHKIKCVTRIPTHMWVASTFTEQSQTQQPLNWSPSKKWDIYMFRMKTQANNIKQCAILDDAETQEFQSYSISDWPFLVAWHMFPFQLRLSSKLKTAGWCIEVPNNWRLCYAKTCISNECMHKESEEVRERKRITIAQLLA